MGGFGVEAVWDRGLDSELVWDRELDSGLAWDRGLDLPGTEGSRGWWVREARPDYDLAPEMAQEVAGLTLDSAVLFDGVAPEANISGLDVETREPAKLAEAAPDAEAPDPDDEVFLLGERIADLARRIGVAEHAMLTLLADFDARRGWEDAGLGSCAEWLAWRTGKQPGTAREWVRIARALPQLPRISAAMQAGELSFSKVRALTRQATPANEEALLELAHASSASYLEQTLRRFKALDDARELTVERIRHRNRSFSIYIDTDGTYVVKGRLEPEVGALLMRAVEAASDALFRNEKKAAREGAGGTSGCGEDDDDSRRDRDDDDSPCDCDPSGPITPAQRRADAVGLIAERALGAGFTEGGSGSRAERYQVMLHVDAATLRSERTTMGPATSSDDPRRSDLDGVRVSAETSRRLTCDASIVRVGVGGSPGIGSPGIDLGRGNDSINLDLGRSTRIISPALRRALQLRDQVCRFPGCCCRFTDGHHIKHWADGGETNLRNLILLCQRHHRVVHEGRVQVCKDREGGASSSPPQGGSCSTPRAGGGRRERGTTGVQGGGRRACMTRTTAARTRRHSRPRHPAGSRLPARRGGSAMSRSPGPSRHGPGRRSTAGESILAAHAVPRPPGPTPTTP